ncbi:MAG: metal ABC transporter permease [Bacteroidetes bacterium]|nr:metal ABC transporter permease [Bacteroidota bacterium]
MLELLQYDFFVNALIASLLASIAFGIIGSFVVIKRIVFISGGIAHTAYGGIGLGFLLGFSPLLGAMIFAVGAGLFVAVMKYSDNQKEDSLIGIMWSLGMALGVLFISLKEGYVPNLMGYLFGNILTIPREELFMMLGFDIVIVSIVVIFFKQFQAITFDEEFAKVIGLPVRSLYILLLVLIALTTVILIKLVGIILVVALLTIPATISLMFTKSLKTTMVYSIVLGLFFTIIGLLLSYYLNLVSGATIIMVAVAGYIIANIYKKIYFS